MPSPLAYLVLLLSPLLAIWLFRRLPLTQAIIWTVLGGYLLLPLKPRFDFPIPGLPTIDKDLIPVACALFLAHSAVKAVLRRRSREAAGPVAATEAPSPARPSAGTGGPMAQEAVATRAASLRSPPTGIAPTRAAMAPVMAAPDRAGSRTASRPGAAGAAATADAVLPPPRQGSMILNALIALFLLAPLLTTLNNSEVRIIGNGIVTQAGMRLYDAGSVIVGSLVALLPYLLARRHLASPAAHRDLLKAFCIAGLAYSVLALYEIRMSPQLNTKIYGFFAHDWAQHIRRDGFRPLVFLHHGLWLGIFFAMTIVAAGTLARLPGIRNAGRWLGAALFLMAVLYMSKSLGALVIATVLLGGVLLMGVRGRLILAATLAMVVLFYPILRGAGWVPVATIQQVATDVSAERGQSLAYRLDNEDRLLAHANEKPLTGWGLWGRWMLFDARTGKSTSVSDGSWIIVIGQFGWLGYIAEFGLLTIPVILLWWRRRRLEVDLATSGLALMLVANLVDLLPNGTLTPITWLVAGALAGRVEMLRQDQGEGAPSRGRARLAGSRRGVPEAALARTAREG